MFSELTTLGRRNMACSTSCLRTASCKHSYFKSAKILAISTSFSSSLNSKTASNRLERFSYWKDTIIMQTCLTIYLPILCCGCVQSTCTKSNWLKLVLRFLKRVLSRLWHYWQQVDILFIVNTFCYTGRAEHSV